MCIIQGEILYPGCSPLCRRSIHACSRSGPSGSRCEKVPVLPLRRPGCSDRCLEKTDIRYTHYDNMPMQYMAIFTALKTKQKIKFQLRSFDIFLILL